MARDPDEVQPVSKSLIRILIAAGAIIVISGVAVAMTLNGFDSAATDSSKTLPADTSNDQSPTPLTSIGNAIRSFDTTPKLGTSTSVDWEAEENRVANKSAITGLRQKLNSATSLIQRIEEQRDNFNDQLDGLRVSEAGSKIASSSDHVESYILIDDEFFFS